MRTLNGIPLELWSPIHFCVPALAEAAGARPEAFAELLRQCGDLLGELHRRGVDRTRAEQYGVRFSAAALRGHAEALGAVLAMACGLAERGQDPGWLLQVAVPELWSAADEDDAVFESWLPLVEATASSLGDLGISIGYPFATGLAALAGHGSAFGTHLAAWLSRIVEVSKSLSEGRLSPYGFFEFGLSGLGRACSFPAGSVTRALDIALDLADRGTHPGDLLQVSFGLTDEEAPDTVEEFLAAAERCASSGIDPLFVLTGGFVENAALLEEAPNGVGALDRILHLGEQLHARGHSLRKTFEDGLPALREMEEKLPGHFGRGFALAEQMVQSGLDPGLTLAWGLPRALAEAAQRPWLEGECLAWANDLAAVGADPAPALAYAVPPLLEMAGTEVEAFRMNRAELHEFIAMLARFGVN